MEAKTLFAECGQLYRKILLFTSIKVALRAGGTRLVPGVLGRDPLQEALSSSWVSVGSRAGGARLVLGVLVCGVPTWGVDPAARELCGSG
jgi:hypothetical protein